MIVSVVTPSYNQGRFIAETLRSVLAQKGDFFLDYHVMDGGSTDESVEVISHWAEAVAGGIGEIACRGIAFRWVSEKDGGQVDALKKGFARADGEILCWLNSDDVFLHDRVLQTAVDHFSADPDLGLLTGDGLFIDEAGKTLGVHHVDRIRMEELLFLDYHILQPASFFRKAAYQNAGLADRYICAFDADFFIGLLQAGVPYRKIDDPLAGFRFYPDIKTKKLAARRYREQFRIARQYAKNPYYLAISAFYRYWEIVLRSRFEHRRWFRPLFRLVYLASYRLILGKHAGRW